MEAQGKVIRAAQGKRIKPTATHTKGDQSKHIQNTSVQPRRLPREPSKEERESAHGGAPKFGALEDSHTYVQYSYWIQRNDYSIDVTAARLSRMKHAW